MFANVRAFSDELGDGLGDARRKLESIVTDKLMSDRKRAKNPNLYIVAREYVACTHTGEPQEEAGDDVPALCRHTYVYACTYTGEPGSQLKLAARASNYYYPSVVNFVPLPLEKPRSYEYAFKAWRADGGGNGGGNGDNGGTADAQEELPVQDEEELQTVHEEAELRQRCVRQRTE